MGNMKRYRITGLSNRIDKFFEVSRNIPLIVSSWPYEGSSGYEGTIGKGYYIQTSPTLPQSEFLLYAICAACEIKCDTVESAYEKDLKDCKDFLKFILCAVEKGHLTCTGMDVQRLRELSK